MGAYSDDDWRQATARRLSHLNYVSRCACWHYWAGDLSIQDIDRQGFWGGLASVLKPGDLITITGVGFGAMRVVVQDHRYGISVEKLQ